MTTFARAGWNLGWAVWGVVWLPTHLGKVRSFVQSSFRGVFLSFVLGFGQGISRWRGQRKF